MLDKIKNLVSRRVNRYRYRKLTAAVEKPNFSSEQLKKEGYHSQAGQDKWVMERLLPGKTDGIFVDIGANDGLTLSNTYYLEKKGWTGLAIEPIPQVYEKLSRNRACVTIHGCVAAKSGRQRFRAISGHPQMLSGLVDQYDSRHLGRIERELASFGGEYTDIEVDCYNFNELLEQNGITSVDYLNIDVEGAEYKILTSIDFDRVHIAVIGVENNYSDLRISDLLTKKGFTFHSIVGDEFYRNNRTG